MGEGTGHRPPPIVEAGKGASVAAARCLRPSPLARRKVRMAPRKTIPAIPYMITWSTLSVLFWMSLRPIDHAMAAHTSERRTSMPALTRTALPVCCRSCGRACVASTMAATGPSQVPRQLTAPRTSVRQSWQRARQQCLQVASASAWRWLKHFIVASRARAVACTRLAADVQRRDAEGQGVPADVGQSVESQALGEGLAIGEVANARRQVAIGVVLAARDELADERQYIAEIRLIHAPEEPVPRSREFQDGDAAAGLCHAHHFR